MERPVKNTGAKTALVLGATGGIGSATAKALAHNGWKIRALSRTGAPANPEEDWEWVKGDAMDRASVVAASKGTNSIVHAVNPPGYRNWSQLVLPMIENTIAAARESDARILLPGTIYNYGPDAFPVLKEESPQNATTHKGTIRIALEKLLETSAQDGVRSLIVRFGDFFGSKPGNSWFSQGMVKPGQIVTSISYPGRPGVGHNWAYLPDAGAVFASLMDHEADLATFACFHFRGHWDKDGTEMIGAIRRATGRPDLKVKSMPWFLFRLLSPFNETMRELHAMRPLWEQPIELDNGKLAGFLGSEPHTSLDEAVSASLRGLGCLPHQSEPSAVPDAGAGLKATAGTQILRK
jgi:nucleoside-diphosphate-sugar epimerase